MVNVFTVVKPLLQGLMKLVGMTPKLVEIEPGTVMNFWVPNETIQRNQNQNHTNHKTNKPALVLVHGFFGDGIITWLLQVLALTGRYAVYVLDLLFFGGSTTNSHHRSTTFQAECLAKGLRKLRVENCTLVGFSYGGMVGFKMAKLDPDLVESLVISGTVLEFTESISLAWLQKNGFSRWSELLLPETVEGLKVLLTVSTHKAIAIFENAGHLVGLERPFIYTRQLKKILASLDGERLQKMN